LNCPSCSSPLLFGASSCSCGYQVSSTEDRPLEISYWEALRAWWRIYWPTQVVALFSMALFSRWMLGAINAARNEWPLDKSLLERRAALLTTLVTMLLSALCLWLFSPRIAGRPYRGFRLVRVPSDAPGQRMKAAEQMSLWFFIWWRQLVGGLAAMLLAMPLNMLLGTMRINAGSELSAFIGLFAIGPIIMKMLMGHPLSGFQIEARRAIEQTASDAAASSA
jgi:hypothetical protein